MSLRWTIGQTWDGQPLPPGQIAHVVVTPGPDALVLELDAPWHGDPPPPGPAGPTWALWEHEVVEWFLLGADDHYLELEFGPHGHQLILQLHGRRQVTARELPLDYAVTRQGDRWTGRAVIPRIYLPPSPRAANAYAIWGQGEQRRYAAAAPVPGPQPDFHRLERFAPVSGL